MFAPPQMPAATSNPSVSPARRTDYHRNSLPSVHPGQNPFSNPRPPLQSPQNYNNGYAHPGMFATPAYDDRRSRGSFGVPHGSGVGPGMGMMPTPDPTVGSCVSEEDKDVAIQLMRLGEMSNMSHGRTSASTLDDAFSGKAEADSSTGATSDEDASDSEEEPPARRQKLDSMGSHKKMFTTESHFVVPQDSGEASGDDADYEDGAEEGPMAAPKLKAPKSKAGAPNGNQSRSSSSRPKSSKPKARTKKPVSNAGPMTPASLPASRKQSIVSNLAHPMAPGEDEQPDLSTKPRCQRCRKSKKGCDRQRPCGRCRDAGIPADQCISEDEGNGRKGRFGRHMGVPIKKDAAGVPAASSALMPAAPIAAGEGGVLPPPPVFSTVDKNKKRKR